MGYRTSSKRRARNTSSQSTTATTKDTTQTKSSPWGDMADRNGDGRIDLDDLLIGLREAFQWALSWRGAMVLYMGFTVMSAWLNVEAWDIVLRPAGQASLTFAVLIWGTLQMNELLPILDELNLKASIGALIRLQRKPVEVPVITYRSRKRKGLFRVANCIVSSDIRSKTQPTVEVRR
jgi:hypothetical protein